MILQNILLIIKRKMKDRRTRPISYGMKIQLNRGMTYVELIVVLSIFATMSSMVLFNYGDFQGKVDIKNLGSDIALKIVEAQKSSLSGVLPLSFPADWKPAYGVYFDLAIPKQFIYFADLNNDKIYNGAPLDTLLDTKNIAKGNSVDKIESCTSPVACTPIPNFPLSITFKRPDSRAFFYSNNAEMTNLSHIQITVKSPKSMTAIIKIYPSGRIQVN